MLLAKKKKQRDRSRHRHNVRFLEQNIGRASKKLLGPRKAQCVDFSRKINGAPAKYVRAPIGWCREQCCKISSSRVPGGQAALARARQIRELQPIPLRSMVLPQLYIRSKKCRISSTYTMSKKYHAPLVVYFACKAKIVTNIVYNRIHTI